MNVKILKISAAIQMLLVSGSLHSQPGEFSVKIPVTLHHYLTTVAHHNLGYSAEQLNVSIAEATINAAKIFPDPEIVLGYSNNEEQKLRMGESFETGISYPFSLGNKRRINIDMAEKKYRLEQFILEGYFKNLKAQASLAYYAALRERSLFQLQESNYHRMAEIARVDSLRLVAGEVNALDALQTSLETKTELHQLFQSQAAFENTITTLSLYQGSNSRDTLYIPSEDFTITPKVYQLSELLENALKNRAELRAAIQNKVISEKNIRFLKAERAFEFSLEAGYARNSVVRNEIAPAPAYQSFSAGIAIPIKFSALNKGALDAARQEIARNEVICREVELQIVTEVTQAYQRYQAMEKQLASFQGGMVEEAEKILNGRIYSYQRGECGLVDVLNAHRTFNELRKGYIETMYECMASRIELERSAATE